MKNIILTEPIVNRLQFIEPAVNDARYELRLHLASLEVEIFWVDWSNWGSSTRAIQHSHDVNIILPNFVDAFALRDYLLSVDATPILEGFSTEMKWGDEIGVWDDSLARFIDTMRSEIGALPDVTEAELAEVTQ